MAGLTVIEYAGSPLEMGRAHGEQARPVVRRALEAWREVTAPSGVAGLLTGSPLLGTVRRLMPELADELRGAAGADQTGPARPGGMARTGLALTGLALSGLALTGLGPQR
ncbi:hypothetical protein ACWEPN_42280 [Nonomuraea wenchangensis]